MSFHSELKYNTLFCIFLLIETNYLLSQSSVERMMVGAQSECAMAQPRCLINNRTKLSRQCWRSEDRLLSDPDTDDEY